jgi:predicted ATPase
MARKRKSSSGPYLLHLDLLRERISDPDRFPYTLPAIRSLERLEFHPKVTFFVGENGSGKSTLLEAIAVAYGLNPEGGGRNFNFASRASHSKLDEAIRLAKTLKQPRSDYFLRAESFYNVATQIEDLKIDLPPYGGKSLHEQSHGESFYALFQNRFFANGLYLMDEPEAALSPKRQLQFLSILHNHIRDGCQFLIATHSPIIMAYPDSLIYLLDGQGIRTVRYVETEHFLITRGFLANPERHLSELLAEPKEE